MKIKKVDIYATRVHILGYYTKQNVDSTGEATNKEGFYKEESRAHGVEV